MAAISTQTFFEKEGIHPQNVEEYFLRGGSPGYAQANTAPDDSAGVEGYANANEAGQEEPCEDTLNPSLALRGGAYQEEAEEYYEEAEDLEEYDGLRGGASEDAEDAEGYEAFNQNVGLRGGGSVEEEYEEYAEEGTAAEEFEAENYVETPYAEAVDADTSLYGYVNTHLRGGGTEEEAADEFYFYGNEAVDGSAAVEDYDAENEDWAAGVEEYAEDDVGALRGGGSVEDLSTGVEEYATAIESAEEEAEFGAEEENYGYAEYEEAENAFAGPTGFALRGGASLDVAPAPDQIPVDENGNIIGAYAVPMFSSEQQAGQDQPQMFVQVIQADPSYTQPYTLTIGADGTVSTGPPPQVEAQDQQQQQQQHMVIDMNAIAAQMQAAQIETQTLSQMQQQQQQPQIQQFQPFQQFQQFQPVQQQFQPVQPQQPEQPQAPPKALAPKSVPAAPKAAKGKTGPSQGKSKAAAKGKSAPPAKQVKGKASVPAKSKSKAAKVPAGAKSKTATKAKSGAPKGKGKA